METDSSLPLCIGPGCSRQALQDSVYCGTDCILQHAAVTMKTLSGPKVAKSRGRPPKKPATAKPTPKGQRSARMSKRLAIKAEEEGEEEEAKEDGGGQEEAASPLACDPSLTEAQATSIPSSKCYTASIKDSEELEAGIEAAAPSKPPPEDPPTDVAPPSQPATQPTPQQSQSQEKANQPITSCVPEQQPAESDPPPPSNPAKSSPSPAAPTPSTSAPRHHETGALMVTKTTYVIPKKQPGPQPPSGHASTSGSGQKPSSAPTLLNETRNLLVPPAPSAPSSRPSQPNTQVRQSIQRSLTSILFKRVCDCEDLEVSESEVAKLVASIEMEMFDIFRNTDSKYMNKYRTIMFNLKDVKNKGLLSRVVRGEISPFRLARMSQKDMQATKVSEPSAKATTEVKVPAAEVTSLPPKPEAVKLDLPSLNPPRPERNTVVSQEQKKSLPAPALKTKTIQPSQASALPDILACMLKDTTSEHKAHLFDLKCKICTGQMQVGEEEEPVRKKPRVSETRDRHEPPWRKSTGNDSPLMAPPDSPDMDSPTSSLMDPTSRLIIDAPALTIVESPASPVMDSPASPVMESPASPTPDPPKATVQKRSYTPVVIPAVSTVTITRRDPRTAASRFPALSSGTSNPSNTTHNQSVPYAPLKEVSALSSATALSQPPVKSIPKPLPKSILMKPSSSVDPRLYGSSSRTVISESPADGETSQYLAKQEIVWKGFLNMLSVAKFVTKGYLVSGSAENLKADLPDTIQIGGRILPQTVWEYVAKLKSSLTKELCVIRFHPATEEEEVAYVSLFSYFSSRGRFGVVANGSRSIKDVYLVPLSAKESIPSILQPFDGPGLEKNRPNLLLGLAVIQKTKRPGISPQETEEKRPKVHMSKDPMWIPKPPVLYGSDKLEIFQPYDPETPASTSPHGSPPCPGSPSDSSSSGSVTLPSCVSSIRTHPPDSVAVAATQSTISDKNPTTASSNKTPLQTILKSLFGKQSDSVVSSEGSSTTKTISVKKVSRSMVDPIVEQYGQKSKIKKMEEEENNFDRPYDPEEEYDPAMGYGVVAPLSIAKNKADSPAISGFVDDDVAYDPEDETIFADIQKNIVVKKSPVPTQTSDPPSCQTPTTTQIVAPAPAQTSPAGVVQNIPTGTVVVSAATLTEQQRMLEELNKQIEEQKRQLKEQEEALRQQREAVGMFMAHFSVSDSLMSPPQKPLPLSQQSGSTDKTNKPTETLDSSNVDSQTVKLEVTTAIPNLGNDTVTEQDETQENVKESDKYASAGEIEDSDVAYDPEDESLFNEIQDDVFQGGSTKTLDSSLSTSGRSASRKGILPNSYHSRKRRLSPKKRSHRERDHHRSPSRKSQQRSPSHSRRRRERERHKRSERDRSRHRAKEQPERQGRQRKEHTTHRHSHGRRRSPSSPRKKHTGSLSPKQHRGSSPQFLEKSKPLSVLCNAPDSSEGNTSSPFTLATVKNDPDGQLKSNFVESIDKGFPPSSHELHHNVKLETSEPPKPQEPQKTSVSGCDDTGSGSSTQLDKLSLQEILFADKLDSTIPLREIDPPIRDSPQSPDPEPQFVKPSSIEKSNSVKVEEIRDPLTNASVPSPHVKVENNCLPIEEQDTMSNILWPTVGGPMSNVRNMDFIALNVNAPDVKDNDMIEADKQIEGKISGLKHPDILSQGVGHLSRVMGSDIQGSGTEIDPVPKNPGPVMSLPGIRDAGSDMKELGHRGPQIHLMETGTEFPGSDTKVVGMQGISHNMWGRGSHTQDLFGMQGVNPEVKGPGLEMRHTAPEMRGQMLITAVTNSQGTREPSSAIYHPSPENLDGRPGVMEIGRDQSSGGPQIEGRNPHTVGMRSCPSFRDSGKFQRELRHDGSSTSEQRGPLKRGFQSHGRDADSTRMRGGQERTLDSNVTTGSEGRDLRADRLPSAMTDERWGLQRGQDIPVRGPGPILKYESSESSTSCIGQDSSGHREHFKEPQTDIRTERSMHGPDSRESETMHESRRPDLTERCYMEPGQDSSTSGSDTKGDGLNLDWRGPVSGGVGHVLRDQRSQKGMNPHMKGPDWSGPRSDIRDDWRGPERRGAGPVRGGPFQDEYQPDRRGPNMESLGPDRRCVGDIDFKELGTEMSGPIMVALRHDRRGPGGPDFRGTGAESRGPSIEGPGPDRSGLGGPDFRGQTPERRNPAVEGPGPFRSGPGGHDFRGPGHEMRGAVMEGPGPDRRTGGPECQGFGPERRGSMERPAGQDFRGPGPESRSLSMEPDRRGPGPPDFRSPAMEGPVHDRRGPGGPDFRRPVPERRGPAMEGPGPDRRGPGGPDFRGPVPERRGPAMEGPGPDRRGPGGPDFRGPVPERRGPAMEGPGSDRRGPGGQDFRGPVPERRGPAMEGPGPDRRGPGGPDFRGPMPESSGPAMEGPGPDRRGPGGPDFRGPVPERRGPPMEGPGPDRRGPGGPDFRGPVPERRGPPMECPGLDRRGPGGPDFRGPVPERRGPAMEGLGPDGRGPGGPDFRRPAPERRGPAMEGPGPDRRGTGGPDFTGPVPEQRSPAMEGPGPDRRRPGGPDFRGPVPERRGPPMEGLGPDRRGPGGPDFMGPVPERRGQALEGPGPDRRGPGGPDFRGPVPERRGSAIEGPGPDRRAPGGPDFRGPVPERRSPAMEGPGPDRRGPGGPDFRGPVPESRGQALEGPGPDRRGPGGPDFRGPVPERRGPAMEGPGPDRRGPGGPDFRGPVPDRRGPGMGGPGPDRRGPGGPDFGGPGHERRGPAMDRQPDRRGPGDAEFQTPGLDRRGPELRGPVWESRVPSMKDQGPDRRGPEDENIDGLGPDKRGPYVRGPGPSFTGIGPEIAGLGIEGPGQQSRGQGGPHFRGPGPECGQNVVDPGLDRRGPNIRGPRLERTGAGMEGPGPNRRVPGGPDMRRPGLQYSGPNRGEGPEGSDFRGHGPERRPSDMEGLESDWKGPHIRGLKPKRAVSEGPGPERKRSRHPDFRGLGCENRGPDFEGPGPGRQEPGGSGFRDPERRGPDTEGPGPDWRRSGGPDYKGPSIRQESPNTAGLRHGIDDWGEADFGGSDVNQESPDIEGHGSDGTVRNLRGSRSMRGDIGGTGPDMSSLDWGDRRRGPGVRGSALDRRGRDTEAQWSEGRGPSMETLGNEGECSGDDWKRHGNSGPCPIQEFPEEQVQEYSGQGPCREWRVPESRGSRPMQERTDMPFLGPLRGPGDDRSGPGCMGPEQVQEHPDMLSPGCGRGGPGIRRREPDRMGARPSRRGRGPFCSGERDPDNRGQGHDRSCPGMREPGSDMRGEHRNDWRQPDFRGDVGGRNMEEPGVHRGAPGLINACPTRGDIEMEGHDRRGPKGLNLRHPEHENRLPNIESSGTDRRFSGCGGLGAERQGVDMENPRSGRQGFEHDFRRNSRGRDMRRLGPSKTDIRGLSENSDIRHGPGRWNTNTEIPGSDRRCRDMRGPGLDSKGSEPAMKDDMQGPDIRGPGCDSRGPDMMASPLFNSPHQVARSQGPREQHSAQYNGPQGPTQNSGGNPSFDNLKNPQAVKPQKHRAALLPTPTGLIRFPNRRISSPDVLSPRRKQIGHPADRERSRGRPLSRERELVKGQKQEQEKGPGVKTSSSVDESTRDGEGKKVVGNETDKHDACVETKTNECGNKNNVQPS